MPGTTLTLTSGDLRLSEFVERLASSQPVPGGGSASAATGSLAAGLVAMVASLSQGRERYAAHAGLHAQTIESGRRLAARFLELADDDAEAYAGFAAALKLPRETDEQLISRRGALSVAAREAAEVPLAIVRTCLELVASAESLAGRSNTNASSDLKVAALLGEAAARGAAENVLVNLPSVEDESYVGRTTAEVMRLLDDVDELAAATNEAIRSGTLRDPLTA